MQEFGGRFRIDKSPIQHLLCCGPFGLWMSAWGANARYASKLLWTRCNKWIATFVVLPTFGSISVRLPSWSFQESSLVGNWCRKEAAIFTKRCLCAIQILWGIEVPLVLGVCTSRNINWICGSYELVNQLSLLSHEMHCEWLCEGSVWMLKRWDVMEKGLYSNCITSLVFLVPCALCGLGQ